MTPYMPEVDAIPEQQEATLRMARQIAVKGKVLRPGGIPESCVALITPGRIIVPIPCPPPGSCGSETVAALRRLVPTVEPQAITVIAFNDVTKLDLPDHLRQRGLTAPMIESLIPFLGCLLGLAYLGHSVVIFEGHSSALALGCRDADLLIIDEAMAVHLPKNCARVALGSLRTPRIVLFRRDGRVGPIVPSRDQPFAAPDQDVNWKAAAGPTGLVRALGNAPLMMTMPNPESYMPKATAGAPQRADKKTCPRCGKELNVYAVKCRFCKAEL